jgi:hypothetical protein
LNDPTLFFVEAVKGKDTSVTFKDVMAFTEIFGIRFELPAMFG